MRDQQQSEYDNDSIFPFEAFTSLIKFCIISLSNFSAFK
jgi:hypothetical protein